MKKRNLIIGIISGMVVMAAVVTKLLLMLQKFKRNADFCFMMSHEELDYEGEEFEDTTLALLGSNVVVDLSKAEASENPMNLCIKSVYSNTEIVVPKGWNVKVQGDNRHSNVDNATFFDKQNFEAPLLFVNYRLRSSNLAVFYGYPQKELVVAEELPLDFTPEEV